MADPVLPPGQLETSLRVLLRGWASGGPGGALEYADKPGGVRTCSPWHGMAWHGMAGAMSLRRGHCSRGWKRRQVVSRRKGDHTGSTSVAQEGTGLPVPHLPPPPHLPLPCHSQDLLVSGTCLCPNLPFRPVPSALHSHRLRLSTSLRGLWGGGWDTPTASPFLLHLAGGQIPSHGSLLSPGTSPRPNSNVLGVCTDVCLINKPSVLRVRLCLAWSEVRLCPILNAPHLGFPFL